VVEVSRAASRHIYVTLAIQSDPESHGGNSVASGRASRARQVKGVDPEKRGYPVPPGSGLGVELTTPKAYTTVSDERGSQSPPRTVVLLLLLLLLLMMMIIIIIIIIW
jgi:hypothetical protein